jgi:D-psicose/D-tagatose/L-ribulose 3-epimerase
MMKIALCNEVLQPMEFARQCEFAADLGYDGLELAPFTLSDEPHLMPQHDRATIRRAAQDAGIAITGLHWLLVTPTGLSITSADGAVRARTVDVMRRLIDLCRDLGGSVLVHGSPAQRAIPTGDTPGTALARARDCFAQVADHAAKAGVTYCIEPLSRKETQLINTVGEAAAIVRDIGNHALRTMIDTSAAAQVESEAVASLIDRWLPSGLIAHVQLNDRNRRGPGQGEDRFTPVLTALVRGGYDRVVAVEPFQYVPDGPTAAARAIGYIRGILESLEEK